MGTVNGAYLGAIYAYRDGWQELEYSTSAQTRAGAMADTDGDSHYAAVVEFTVPAFEGVSQTIAFKMWANRLGDEYPSTINLRYAICNSDANKDSYLQTNAEVTDSNQIASGTVELTDVSIATESATWQTVTIETDALKEGTWYLMLWGASEASANEVLVMQGTAYHDSIALTYGDPPEEPESTFCPVSFRLGLAAALASDGWYKEVQ